jgi:hypothetical protein
MKESTDVLVNGAVEKIDLFLVVLCARSYVCAYGSLSRCQEGTQAASRNAAMK